MNKFSAMALVLLVLLSIFGSVAMAANNNNTSVTTGNNTVASTVEIRGPVYSGTDLNDIIANNGTDGAITMDANKFAAFFYDINNNITTETLSIKNVSGTSGRTIGENGLVYSTTIAQTDYQYTKDADNATLGAWGKYSVLGFFADKYIPITSNDASKLAKLIIDSDDKYTLTTGQKLDLSNGYTLQVNQVDVNGQKVWLEFQYNGQHVDDAVIDTSTGDHTWTSQIDKIQGQDNVNVLKVHVNQVFQGADSSIAQIDGLWLIDFENAIAISTSDSFGKLDNVALNGDTISIDNKDTFSLTRNSDVEIGNGLYFKVADSDALRFYAYKQQTAPGVYDVRGTVATGAYVWNAANFAGFFYDLKKDVSTESLQVASIADRTIPENGLIYSTTIKNVDYKYTQDADNNSLAAWGSYPVIGFMAQEFVPLLPTDASKLANLIVDSDDKYSLVAGNKLDMGKGYTLQIKQVDVNGNKAWLELDKDGQYVDDSVVDVSTGDHTWTSTKTVLSQQDVPIFKVHISQVFQGAEQSVAQIDGLWLIDYANAMTIDSSATFGKLDNIALNGDTITINNKNSFTLTRDTAKLDINGQGMYFNVADANELRYYPFVEETIGNGTLATVPSTPTTSPTNVTTPTKPTNVTVPETNVTVPETNVTAPVTQPPVEQPTQNAPVTQAPSVANNTTTTTQGSPGFGALAAIVGLLVVVYFVRKYK